MERYGKQGVIENWVEGYASHENQRQEVCAYAQAGNVAQLVEMGFPADIAVIMRDWQSADAPDVIGSFLHPEGLDAAYLYGMQNVANFSARAPELAIHLDHFDTVGYRKSAARPLMFGSFGVPINPFGVVEVGKASAAASSLYELRNLGSVQGQLESFAEGQASVVSKVFSQIEKHVEAAILEMQVRHKRKDIKALVRSHLEDNHADLVAAYSEALQVSAEPDGNVYMSKLLMAYKQALGSRVIGNNWENAPSQHLLSEDPKLMPLIRRTLSVLLESRGINFIREVAEPNEGLCLFEGRNTTRKMLVVDDSGHFKVIGDGEERVVEDEAVPHILLRGLPLAKLFVVSLICSGSVYHLGSEQAQDMRGRIIAALGIESEAARAYLMRLHLGQNKEYGNKGVMLKGSRTHIPLPLLYLLLGPDDLRDFVAIRQGHKAKAMELSSDNLARLVAYHLVRKAASQLRGQAQEA